jgi:hypothetical protein
MNIFKIAKSIILDCLFFLLVLIGTAFSQNWWDDNGGLRDGLDFDMDPDYCDTEGWEIIFDGTPESVIDNLWLSNASHGSGGNWWVDTDPDGEATGKLAPGQLVLWSTQNPGGDGGVAYTHRLMENMECEIKFWPGWANDAGIFFRSNGNGAAFEIMLNYQPGNTVGGVWPERIAAGMQKLYSFQAEDRIDAQGITWDPNDWADIWDPDGYNLVSGKIWDESYLIGYIHDPEHVVTDYQQGGNDGPLFTTGYVGFQIHGGAVAWTGGPNKYLYIKIRELDDNGEPICIGTKTSVCNIKDYQEYDASWESDDNKLGDPSKCLNFGEATPSGCMDSMAINFNPEATIDDGSCEYIDWCCGDPNFREFDTACRDHHSSMCITPIIIEGCADPDYVEYNSDAMVHVQDSCKTLGVRTEFTKGPVISLSPSGISIDGEHTLKVLNVNGEVVFSGSCTGPKTYNLSEYEPRIYFVDITAGKVKVLRRVVVF